VPSLWIEAGDMSGGSRNQIEFDDDLAAFFGIDLPPIGASTQLSIDVTGTEWHECILAAKVTSFQVTIYRLNLPTVAKGGHDYAGSIIRFTHAGGRYFRALVAEQNSPEHQAWRAESVANGSLSRTGGAAGREFGYNDV
jgi:hypothetical protein